MIRIQDSIAIIKYMLEMHSKFLSLPAPFQYLAMLHRWVSNFQFPWIALRSGCVIGTFSDLQMEH